MTDIIKFTGEYRWLSNFHPVDIEMGGVVYKSIEHAYMSQKSDDEGWKSVCLETTNPGKIKRLSRGIKLVDNWDSKKIAVMNYCIIQKFTQEPFRTKLLETGDRLIQEGNLWHDTFWGIDLYTGIGLNNLGKLIMSIRFDLSIV